MSEHRPELPTDFDVRVDQLNEEGRATYLAGIFRLKGREFSFEAIAIEGYGGPNIAAKLSDSTLASLRELGLSSEDIDGVIVVIQRKIMEGGAEFNVHREAQPERG